MALTILWLLLCFLSFGMLGFRFFYMKQAASKVWKIKIDKNYKPSVSIVVPTYNESEVIRLKLENLSKVEYPRNLKQIVIIDSQSDDQTIDIVNEFVKLHRELDITVLVESKRKGKSAALNFALEHCTGDVIIVSDADSFLPSDILSKALPFLADPEVGAISGPKILLNPEQSLVTKMESSYLNSLNLIRLGESKICSTLFFEGGFSAYKKNVLDSFDPYNTGSDDNGTVIRILQKNFRTIFVPAAEFYTVFPTTWREKMAVKMRRANQLLRVFGKYTSLLLKGNFVSSKNVILWNLLVYFLSPTIFVLLLATTVLMLLNFPYFALAFLILLIPKVRLYVLEAVLSYFILILTAFAIAFKKRFVVWSKPKDRALIAEDVLLRHELI
jgi:cellulose synthase/poly-beta-1,6-N-acetylglucosamine synthase-like glycosyltransferase